LRWRQTKRDAEAPHAKTDQFAENLSTEESSLQPNVLATLDIHHFSENVWLVVTPNLLASSTIALTSGFGFAAAQYAKSKKSSNNKGNDVTHSLHSLFNLDAPWRFDQGCFILKT
jgi:hypothetical protein